MNILLALAGFAFLLWLAKFYKRFVYDFRTLPGPSPWLSLPILGRSLGLSRSSDLCPFHLVCKIIIRLSGIGHSWLLGSNPVAKLLEMRAKYGNVFRFDIGFMPSVILMGYEECAEAFKREALAGRSWSQYPHMEHIYNTRTRDGKICWAGSAPIQRSHSIFGLKVPFRE